MLKGLKFSRPVMPVDARDTKMRLLTGADAADQVLVIGAWGGFQRRDNSWSSQHILGRNVLADETSTIPKKELDALCGASNMSWIVRSALIRCLETQGLLCAGLLLRTGDLAFSIGKEFFKLKEGLSWKGCSMSRVIKIHLILGQGLRRLLWSQLVQRLDVW